MKYKAIIETDDFKDFIFFEDGNGKYLRAMDITGAVNSEWIALYFTECKQESVLDKIRAEIEQRPYGIANDSVIQGMRYERVAILEILDKYKAEMEKK